MVKPAKPTTKSDYDVQVDLWVQKHPLPPLTNQMPARVEKAVERHLRGAGEVAMNAAYSGEHHDGGAGAMYQALKWFVLGWRHELPDTLRTLEAQVLREEDPEWKDYQRLKKKFEQK